MKTSPGDILFSSGVMVSVCRVRNVKNPNNKSSLRGVFLCGSKGDLGIPRNYSHL